MKRAGCADLPKDWAGSVYACQATFFAWANDVLRYEEDSLRAVVIASMNMGSNAVNAW